MNLNDILDSIREDWQNDNADKLISECEFEDDLLDYIDPRSEDYYDEEEE